MSSSTPDKPRFQFSGAGTPLLPFNICLPRWGNTSNARYYIQGPTSTRYSNRTRIFLYYSNPTRKFLKNDRVASSMYTSHFRKIAARLTIFCCPWYKTFPFWQKFDQRSSWKSCHLIFLSSASSKTQIYFQHVNVFKMLLTIIMTMVMMTIISAMIIITKYSLPTIDFATLIGTRIFGYIPTRTLPDVKKNILVDAWSWYCGPLSWLLYSV